MSNVSVDAIRLPSSRASWRGLDFSRRAVHTLLERLQVGTLELHDEGRVSHYGRPDSGGVSAVIHVRDPAAFQSILTGGVIGAGESYMMGFWSSPCLTDVIRLFSANIPTMAGMDSRASLLRRGLLKVLHLLSGNSLNGARRNIGAHYDLGNDFFALFLDPTMMYSSAVYPHQDASLDEAATHKLDLLCEQLELAPTDHLLEIGTGWGGMAIHAARHYGCRVTTTTISRQQYEYASQRVRELGLEDRITVLCEDYRKLSGRYDKIVSIEMIEAVGHEYYAEYFRRCNSLLKPDGKLVIQAITVPDQRYRQTRDRVDFIKRYIFPGGCLPSMEVINRHIAAETNLQLVNLRDITEDYAQTLADWRQAFLARLDEVQAQGFDEVFQRMWEFYLCYCEGGFRERIIGTVQLSFAGPDYRPGRDLPQ